MVGQRNKGLAGSAEATRTPRCGARADVRETAIKGDMARAPARLQPHGAPRARSGLLERQGVAMTGSVKLIWSADRYGGGGIEPRREEEDKGWCLFGMDSGVTPFHPRRSDHLEPPLNPLNPLQCPAYEQTSSLPPSLPPLICVANHGGNALPPLASLSSEPITLGPAACQSRNCTSP